MGPKHGKVLALVVWLFLLYNSFAKENNNFLFMMINTMRVEHFGARAKEQISFWGSKRQKRTHYIHIFQDNTLTKIKPYKFNKQFKCAFHNNLSIQNTLLICGCHLCATVNLVLLHCSFCDVAGASWPFCGSLWINSIHAVSNSLPLNLNITAPQPCHYRV